MFGLGKKTEAPAQTVTRDPLSVVPVKPDMVELKHDSAGNVHLRLLIPPKGFAKRVADWLGYDYSRKVQLDEYGTLFYDQVDGQTPLKSIVKKMAQQHGVSLAEMEQSVILFTKKLMVMDMLALKIPERIPSRKNA